MRESLSRANKQLTPVFRRSGPAVNWMLRVAVRDFGQETQSSVLVLMNVKSKVYVRYYDKIQTSKTALVTVALSYLRYSCTVEVAGRTSS